MIHPERIIAFTELLGQSQFWPPEKMRRYQDELLSRVVHHAYENVPYYRDRLAPLFRRRWGPRLHKWSEVPILTREEVHEHREALKSRSIPADHGAVHTSTTSGSIGLPLTTDRTELSRIATLACVNREHERHRRDPEKSFAIIIDGEPAYPKGQRFENWSVVATALGQSGEAFSLDSATPTHLQAEWLRRIKPAYLSSFPSNLAALADRSLTNEDPLPALEGLASFAEMLTSEQRVTIKKAWGLEPVDNYSSSECGAIASQSDQGGTYLVNDEIVLVELLDQDGAPAPPEAQGRVVVTCFYNYAMPLIRYAVGDYAIQPATCEGPYGLSQLTTILGRQRNMFHYPDGGTYWPSVTNPAELNQIIDLSQRQFIEHNTHLIEMKYVAPQAASAEQAALLVAYLKQVFHANAEIRLTRVQAIERHKSGKFEEYKSLVSS